MKLNLVVTSEGFRPAADEDYELKKKLKRGSVVRCTVVEFRNYGLHRKYFALINCAWEYLTEQQREFFYDNVESFRKTVEVSAGHCEPVYNRTSNEWYDMPKSISFDSMSESEFEILYERVRDVLYQMFIPSVNKQEFEEELKVF